MDHKYTCIHTSLSTVTDSVGMTQLPLLHYSLVLDSHDTWQCGTTWQPCLAHQVEEGVVEAKPSRYVFRPPRDLSSQFERRQEATARAIEERRRREQEKANAPVRVDQFVPSGYGPMKCVRLGYGPTHMESIRLGASPCGLY